MSTTLIRADGRELTFDATIVVSYQKQNVITEHPIEDGAVVSDHVQKQPDTVNLTGIVSDSPLGATGEYNVENAVRFLNEVGEAGELLELDSRLGLSGNWALEAWPHDVTAIRALTFEITLKQVRIATTETVILPREVPKPAVADSAPPEVDVGKQSPAPVSPVEAAELKSRLAAGLDAAAAFFGGS